MSAFMKNSSMDEDVLVQELVNRLTFEVETITDKVKPTNGTPLNVKVRVRNKDEPKLIHRGLVSLPRIDSRISVPKRIQLIGSEQTILSFNVFMAATSSKESASKSRRHGFHFFKLGGCLGTSYDEDNGPYLPSSSNKNALRSKRGSKTDSIIIDEVEDLPETFKINSLARNQKGLFGNCKPGGCLDPPFGEDKYPYIIPKVQPQKNLESQEFKDGIEDNDTVDCSVELKKISKVADKSSKTVTKVEVGSKPLPNIFARTGENHSLTSNYSNSIITYSLDLTSSKTHNNDQGIEKKNKNGSFDSGSLRQSFEYTETYFVPPKDILRHKEEERRYSKELSNYKMNHDDRHKNDTTHGGLRISNSNFLTNKDVVEYSEKENNSNETNESADLMHKICSYSNLREIAPLFFTNSININDLSGLNNVQGKKEKQETSSMNTFSNKNNYQSEVISQSSIPEPLAIETEVSQETNNLVNDKNTNIYLNPKDASPAMLTSSINIDDHKDLKNILDKKEKQHFSSMNMTSPNISKQLMTETIISDDTYPNKGVLICSENVNEVEETLNSIFQEETISAGLKEITSTKNLRSFSGLKDVPGEIEKKETSSMKTFSNENNCQIELISPSIIPELLAVETVVLQDISNLVHDKNTNIHLNSKDATSTIRTGSINIDGLRENPSTTNQFLKLEDTGTVAATENTSVHEFGGIDIEKFGATQVKHEYLSHDSIISENKEFATSSIDSIGSTENLTLTCTQAKNKSLNNRNDNLLKGDLPLNMENFIIQKDALKQEKSDAVFPKSPFIETDEVSKINPLSCNTSTIIARNSLQNQIENISSQHNVIQSETLLEESALMVSKVTERSDSSNRLINTNSDSAINVPQHSKGSDSRLLVLSLNKATPDYSVHSSLNITNTIKVPTELASQSHNIEDAFAVTDPAKPISEISLTADPIEEANDLVPEFSSTRDHVVVDAKYGSQSSTVFVGNVDTSESLKVFEQNEFTNKTITPIQSVTNSTGHLKENDVVDTKFGVDIKSKSDLIKQHDSLTKKLQKNIFTADVHLNSKIEAHSILMNLSFQSYVNDNNERVVQTLNPLVKPYTRYTNDTITTLATFIRHGNEIKIQVDPENDLVLYLLNKNQKPKDLNSQKNKFANGHLQSNNNDENQPTTHPDDVSKNNLTVMFENELIPLHKVIKDLIQEMNALLGQQELLLTKLGNAKRFRSLRLVPVSNRCGCKRT